MQIKDVVDKLINTKEFKEWKDSHNKSYLAHLFNLNDDLNKNIWQIGFYNPNDTITTFILEGNDIKIVDDEKVFKKTKKKVHKLDVDKVNIDFDRALKIADEFQKNNYKGNDPSKVILILQNVADNIIYNITYITIAINILNIKIDACSGEIISHELNPLMQFTGKAG
jgi:hypothetical protein